VLEHQAQVRRLAAVPPVVDNNIVRSSMMATDIFHEPTRTVPKSDPRIVSQAFDEQQMGARKSAMPKIPKNSLVIRHVEKGR